MTSIKDKFESHPVVFGCGLIIIGAMAGYNFKNVINPSLNSSLVSQKKVECNLAGLEQLTIAYDSRIKGLQKVLMEFESKSSDHSIIGPYQDKYKESANRVREDITQENNMYKESLNEIMAKCE